MSNKLYEENDIQNIANAIRNKNGTEDTYKVSQMSTAINSIEVIEQAAAEGESISLTNTKAMPYKDYKVKGKSEQDGTPSSDYPSEIHSVADDVNLLSGLSIYTANHTISPKLELDIGTYTFSYIGDASTGLYIRKNNAITGQVLLARYNTTRITFTVIEKGDYYIDLYLSGDWNTKAVTNAQLKKGSTLLPYSPYNQGTVTIKQRGTTESNDYTIQTEPLRSLPNGVKDTIEAEQHRKIGTYIFDGTESCVKYAGSTYAFGVYLPDGVPDCKHLSSVDRVLCSHLQHTTLDNIYRKRETQDNNLISTQGTRSFGVMINNFTTTSELQTYLAQQYANGTPVIIQYELAEEIIEPLTQNQATTMLDIIKTGSYEGTTNIYTDEDVKPTIGVDYYKKG